MLDEQWLSTFAPVGIIPAAGQWQPTGACVFVSRHDVVWLATALHVLPKDDKHFGVLAPVNRTRTLFDLTDILSHGPKVDWLTDAKHDLAVAPMPTPSGIGIKALAEQQCFELDQVLPGMSCLTGGCPYGLPGLDRATTTPIILDGVIAGKDAASRNLFISTPTFQGNSGGPIFVVHWPFNASGGMAVGRQTVGLAGIVLRVHTIQTSDAKAAPLRLGAGVAIHTVLELLDGPSARGMVERIENQAARGTS